jgi:hypothetical protein
MDCDGETFESAYTQPEVPNALWNSPKRGQLVAKLCALQISDFSGPNPQMILALKVNKPAQMKRPCSNPFLPSSPL